MKLIDKEIKSLIKIRWKDCKYRSSTEAKYKAEECKDILELIDSLQEEPVSNNYSALLPCIYNRTLEERVKYCKYCSAACEGRVKEPVSDDLEVTAEECIEELLPETALDAATPFALEYVVELLHKAFNAGAKWQKAKLIKNAVNAKVTHHPNDYGEYMPEVTVSVSCSYKEGDKVKVLVINED